MTVSGLARRAPLSGIVFVVLWLSTIILLIDGAGDTDQEILSYYGDDGNRNKEIAGFFLIFAAGLFYLWFLGTLRSRLRLAEGEPGTGSALAFAGGVLSAALFFVAAFFFSGSAFSSSQDDFTLDPNTHRLISDMGYGIWAGAQWLAIVLILATSYVVLRTRVFPLWVGWIGFAVALLLDFSFAFIPFFVFLGWVTLLSGLMTWPERAGPEERCRGRAKRHRLRCRLQDARALPVRPSELTGRADWAQPKRPLKPQVAAGASERSVRSTSRVS